MRISNLQATMLFQILRDSCVIADKANIFTFSTYQRKQLAEDILNQQSRDLVELDTDDIVPIHNTREGVNPNEQTEEKE